VHGETIDVVPSGEPGVPRLPMRILHRGEIVVVNDGGASWGIVFNNQSSWQGACSIPGFSRVHLRIILKSGASATARPAGCTDSAIRLRGTRHIETFAKTDVQEVDLVRVKPGPPEAPRLIQEVDGSPLIAIFVPSEWPLLEHISVRLYDSSIPEDNSPTACAVPPKPRRTPGQQ
jgi:hypothetical protein